MKKKLQIAQIKRDVLTQALPHIPFDGWVQDTLKKAWDAVGHDPEFMPIIFDHGVEDFVFEFARFIDDQMLEKLSKTEIRNLKTHEKVEFAVWQRLQILHNYREHENLAVGFWALPNHTKYGLKSLWQTSDMIWQWAGDTSTDYNRYTKRLLLSRIIAKTTLYWLQDESDGYDDTQAFLSRQITQTLKIGQRIAKIKNFFKNTHG